MINHTFIKFWNIDASVFASHFSDFKIWVTNQQNASWDGNSYHLKNTRNRNYPIISGINSDNMFFLNDLKLIYIHRMCYDCNNIGVTDVSFDENITVPSLDMSTGILTLPDYTSESLQGIQGTQGTTGLSIQGGIGLQGSAGHDAQDLQGIQGNIGGIGLQGFQGTKGERGLDVYNTSYTLSIQGIDGAYYDFNGSQRTIITGIYTLQSYIQGIQGADLSDYITKTEFDDTIKNIDAVKWIDI